MLRTMPLARSSIASGTPRLGVVRKKLARAMVGRTVDLLADSKTIAHGIVTGVFMAAGTPKIIVNGQTYDMSQVLTATTASLH
jgi:hypothetical protein